MQRGGLRADHCEWGQQGGEGGRERPWADRSRRCSIERFRYFFHAEAMLLLREGDGVTAVVKASGGREKLRVESIHHFRARGEDYSVAPETGVVLRVR